MLMIHPDLEIAVVVLANTAYEAVDALAEQLIHMLAGQDVEPAKIEQAVSVPNDVMQRYVGRYQLDPDFIFDVQVKDGKLMVGVTDQPTHRVFARSETEWFYRVVEATLTFQVDEDQCQSVELFQNGIRQTAKRL